MAAPNIDKTMHDRAKIEKSNVVQQPARENLAVVHPFGILLIFDGAAMKLLEPSTT
jgi:hypothetical protein